MKVAFAGSFPARLVEPVRQKLSIPCEMITGDEADVVARLGDVDVLVSMSFNAAMAAAATRLRLLQVPGAGVDRVDFAVLGPRTLIANAFGHDTGIAEYVMGTMLTLTRSFGRLDAALREGRWESQWAVGTPAPPLWPELAGKTLGILGFGHIGQALAKRAAAFDMHVCAIRRQAQTPPPTGVQFVGGPDRLDEVLRRADYIAVTLSLSPETRQFLDARRLALMKPTAVLINVARAEIIEEAALYQALAAGRLAAAALDVWYRYPTTSAPTQPATQPFHELPNVLLTPHVSGWTQGMLDARADVIAANIERTAKGEPLLNQIEVAR